MKLTSALFIFLCCHLGFSQTSQNASERIDSLFSKYSMQTPGVAVAVVKQGEVIFQKGYGSANLEYDIPISANTVFHVASVSKQFTAFAIYLLKDKGLLALDDDVRKYIPELPDYEHTITIAQLLAHTSGLRDQWALLTLAGWRLEDVITTEQIMKLAVKQKGLNFEPGTTLGYCNTSYTLLAEIVSRISGQTFAEYTKQHIFDPLGMTNTQFYDDYHKLVKNRAYSYEQANGGYVKKKLNYSNVGPSSLFTTVLDLAKWAENFNNPIVGNASLIREFNEISRLNNGSKSVLNVINSDTLYHAKGQLLRNYRGIDIYKHGGHDAGFRAFLSRFPQEQMSIITLSNDEHYEIFARGLNIAEFYLEDQMDEAEELPSSPTSSKDIESKEFKTDLDQFTGIYFSSELATTYYIEEQQGKLIISHQRLDDMTLTQIGESTFTGTNYFGFSLKFVLNESGKATGFQISNFGVKDLSFKRL